MKHVPFFLLVWATMSSCGPRWSEKQVGSFNVITNRGGKTIAYSPTSQVPIITKDRFAFKDLNRNNQVDPYEDWRLSFDERAKDLASRMTVEQIAGLMLYSGHQAVPSSSRSFFRGTYNGQTLEESGAKSWDLTDQQKDFLTKDNLRHILVTSVESPEVAARWNNNVQAVAEGLGLGIPANNSSDPRHTAIANTEYNAGSGGTISMWPDALGLAATFDPDLVRKFGVIASQEYRMLGIATALSPQIDLGTEPRWNRINGTFGEDPQLAADMARAYVDGFQTSEGSAEISDGWGYQSVNTMVKHWPSGGPEEGGRDAHFAYGKFAVYPGRGFQTHLIPFLDGAFKLTGKTEKASAVMPYYTISYGVDSVYKENVGNAFSRFIITDLLREKYGYDGVVCTDWLVTADEGETPETFKGKPWGIEDSSVAERHYKALMAGVDQFGGNNEAGPVIEAYQMGVKAHGENFMRKRFELSAVRLLKNIFRAGLFENPYVDPESARNTVGKAEFMTAGFEAQLKSMILLKNKNNVLPLKEDITLYIPKRFVPESRGWFGNVTPSRIDDPFNIELVKKYFNVTDDPAKADAALVYVKSPEGGVGYDLGDRKKGGNGYLPITLQYGKYTATAARSNSIAAGDPVIDPSIKDRSYRGKSVTASNVSDLKSILETRSKMKGKPVIVVVHAAGPMVFQEFEKEVDAILISFGVQDQAVFEVLNGVEPEGLLPLQMPANMETVEQQMEDIPHDMEVHVDTEGNAYDFGYGLNWKGIITDGRTRSYKRSARLD